MIFVIVEDGGKRYFRGIQIKTEVVKILKIHCLLALVLLLGCSDDNGDGFNSGNCLSGQGARIQESRSLTSFHSINNTVVADVLLTQGPQEDSRSIPGICWPWKVSCLVYSYIFLLYSRGCRCCQ